METAKIVDEMPDPDEGRGDDQEGENPQGENRILATISDGGPIPIVFVGKQAEVNLEMAPLTAARWLEVILDPEASWSGLLEIALDPGQVKTIASGLANGTLSGEDVAEIHGLLLSIAAGRPWWEVVNIVAVSEEAWGAIGGEMALHGVLPSQVTLAVWLDAAWTLLRRAAAANGQQELSRLVHAIRQKPARESGADMDEAEFLAAAGELRGSLPGVG
jgi:hypothetical protein